jgi:hypothetical protein
MSGDGVPMSNNDLTRLHELLDCATGRADEELNPADVEAASLRGGWLGLCRLIEAEEQAGRVVQRSETEPIRRPVGRSRRHSSAQPAAWTVWIVTAVAASVLLAVSMTTVVKRFGGQQVVPADGQQVAQNDPPADDASGPSKRTNKNSGDPASAAGDRLQWGESVDDEITAVSRATLLAQDDWYAQSSRIGAVQSGIFDLENEIEQGKP